MKARRGAGIEALEPLVERLGTGRARLGHERGAERAIRGGSRQEPPDERTVVEARAAHQDRPAAAAPDLPDRRGRVAREPGGIVAVVGLDDVHQVVMDRAALRLRGLGGADVHPAIDLARVDAHHLDRPALGERHGHAGLSHARRTEDREERDARRRAVRIRKHRGHQVRRSSRLISPSGIRETIGRPCGQ